MRGYERAVKLLAPVAARARKAGFHEKVNLDVEEDLKGQLLRLWASYDGLGVVYAKRFREADSVKVLEKGLAVLQDNKVGTDTELGRAEYNLACAYAIVEKYDKALPHLKHAFELVPAYKDKADRDHDLVRAMDRREFRALLH
jgi:tetratricopeptide (TPR) repeat protein